MVSDHGHDLDGVLSHPVRLFIVACLVDGQWRGSAEIRAEIETTVTTLSAHLSRLRRAGYVETVRQGSSAQWRLTTLGCDRLDEHVATLLAVATRAGRILASYPAPRRHGSRGA